MLLWHLCNSYHHADDLTSGMQWLQQLQPPAKEIIVVDGNSEDRCTSPGAVYATVSNGVCQCLVCMKSPA